jgi:hypothetical protein
MPAVLPTDSPSSTSADKAPYLGMWNGNFGTTCGRLAVQRVNADGSVQLTYANEEIYVHRGPPGSPPLYFPAASQSYVGNIDQDGLHFITKLGNKLTFKLNGNGSLDAKALLTSGSITSGTFKRQ